jgi:hypothetical protein
MRKVCGEMAGSQALYPGYPGHEPGTPGRTPVSPERRRAQFRVMSPNGDTRGQVRTDRIEQRLRVVGLTAHEASKLASPSGSGDLIRDIIRSKTKIVRMSTLLALADVLECDPEYLTGEQDRPRSAVGAAAPAPATDRAAFSLTDAEIQLIGLMRMAPEESDRILSVVKTLVFEAQRIDERGRKVS